jgi:hypothetical protein
MGITPAFNRWDAYIEEATYLYIICACGTWAWENTNVTTAFP